MSEGMRGRALRAGTWMSALTLVRQPALLIRTFILARLLMPGDFGLVGVMLIVTGLVEGAAALGLRSALVQRSEIGRRHLDTAWTVDIVRGVLSAAAILALAPITASFFDAPDAVNLIRFAALAPLVHGLTNIGTVHFDRDLEYRKKFILQGSRFSVDIAVSVTAAFILHNAWALAFGLVAGAVVAMVLSYVVSTYRPRPLVSISEFRALLQFSLWTSLTRYLRTLNGNLDFILVGRMIDVATLGLYQMAWRISFVVANAFNSMAVPQITFASFARIQDDKLRMRRAYQQMTELILSLALPAAAALAVVAPVLTSVVLDDRWAGVVVPMQILAAAAGVRALRSQASWVTVGAGWPRTVFIRDVLVTSTLIVALVILVPRSGASGAAWAVLISLAVALPLHARDLRRILGLGMGDILRPLTTPLILAGGVAATGALSSRVFGAHHVANLALSVVMMLVVYFLIVFIAHTYFGRGPISAIFARRAERGTGS